MNKLTALILSLLTFYSQMAYAGPYVGIDGATAVGGDSKNAYDLHAGYRIGEIVGVELGYTNLGDTTFNSDIGTAKKDIKFIHASGIAYLPLPAAFTAMLDIYGRLGMGYSKVDYSNYWGSYSEQRIGTFVGVGAEFNMIPFMSLRAELQHLPSIAGDAKTTLFKLGANIKF